jgi:hypothetical protein
MDEESIQRIPTPNEGSRMLAANGGAIAAAAAAAQRLLRQEEEEMTTYSPKDLAEDWEFKILRAGTAVFRKPERLREILEEEKRGGWVLVEKFDDQRIRLKRPAGAKVVVGDFADGYDPYRTEVGTPQVMIALLLTCSAAVFALLVLILFAVLLKR